ncbi:MAG: DNA polymerase III subunit gamma/tau, partial [Candidatus Marinimicrobia bacterium]|nr:DNA polymerase III subunit gamma/tau [Candidatus Neomarinimicrobiota bacterium]
MTYEVLARKWRPQQFKDVIGQEHVTRTLENAIRAQRVAHAYLFVGGRGIGKTTTARILAKALNCQTGPTPTPCDQCDSCREIVAGTHLDVLEIDGASNNSVEQVRELRERAAYTPARGPYKIYIIDEVHMLSNSAFNALLKLLEEPPPHVKFMFATTEPHKVPGTILSRCQRFDLRPIPLREIVAHLGRICEAEGVTIGQDALLAIARGAEGGMRDAESALDQLIAFCGGEITEADVMSVFGLVARRELEALAEALLRGDVPTALRQVTVLDQAGKDMARVVEEILGHLRNLLLVLHAGAGAAELDLTEAQVEVLQAQARETTPPRVLRMAEILTLAQERMRQAPSKRTVIELGLIQAAQAATQVDLDQLLERMAMLRRELAGAPPAPSPVAARPAPRPAPAPTPERAVR